VPELAEALRIQFTQNQDALDSLLLEHTEACETLHRGLSLNVKTGNPGWGLDTPATWTVYHDRLAKLLREYHDYCKQVSVVRAKIEARQQGLDWASVDWRHDYWHLAQWYFLCRKSRVPQWIKGKDGKPRRDRHGKLIQLVQNGQPRWDTEIVRRGEPARVFEGVKWLEVAWRERFRGRPKHIPWAKLLDPEAETLRPAA
jgi:hypothetical protein